MCAIMSVRLIMSQSVGKYHPVGTAPATAAVLQDPISGAQYSYNRRVFGVMGSKIKSKIVQSILILKGLISARFSKKRLYGGPSYLPNGNEI